MSEIHEECGLFGVYSEKNEDVAALSYYALNALQHRGQEGCGIALNDDGVISVYKDNGLVRDVFAPGSLPLGSGSTMAIAHARYGTTGQESRTNVQPLVITHRKGRMALAHNGNLTNDAELRDELELTGSIFHTTSDTEVIAYIITKNRLCCPSIEKAIEKTMEEIAGAYSLLVMSSTKLIAVRDPWGFRPLCLGLIGDGYVFASESCALDAVGATFVRDIEPGEIVVIDSKTVSETGPVSIKTHCKTKPSSLCVFELIYFARPDSIVDSVHVHSARLRAGSFLALEHPAQADVVVGVPDSGLDAAIGYSRQSGIPFGLGFIKNKYIGRTFIQPSQSDREDTVRIKLNPIIATVKDKRVVLIDDSIVRGTTCKRIVKLLRDAGAKEIHFRSSAPKFLYPCYFGTDIDSSEDLFAYKYTDDQMKKLLDVDSLGFLSSENVTKLADHP
ncbi:amidophosphoribosyltransferase, partial [uncultured Sphaerochaeta sp.]|uniref:amidophosphoribosyltransferase n=1 Tax=uncultured Sphaerochaeta sp. TaxID=886478 RepID=UPI002A0A81D6